MNSFKDHTFVIVDVATTGFRPDVDSPVEIAAVKIKNGEVIDQKKWRLDPGVSIPPAASAHHEIRDSDVVGCPSLEDVESDINSFVGDATIVMHNLATGEALDKAMLPFLHDRTWICSARLAKHMYPQLTQNNGFPLANYDVWTLLYWMNETNLNTFGAQVYEPLANAAATAVVFNKTLETYLSKGEMPTIEGIVELTEKPVAFPLMPRGPYKNCYMGDLPEEYLKTLAAKSRHSTDKTDIDYHFTIETEVSTRLQAKFGHTGGVRKFS